MNREIRTLKKQIKELERLVELKGAVIEELKTLIRLQFSPWTYNYEPTITTTSDNIFLNADSSTDVTTVSSDTLFTLTGGEL